MSKRFANSSLGDWIQYIAARPSVIFRTFTLACCGSDGSTLAPVPHPAFCVQVPLRI